MSGITPEGKVYLIKQQQAFKGNKFEKEKDKSKVYPYPYDHNKKQVKIPIGKKRKIQSLVKKGKNENNE